MNFSPSFGFLFPKTPGKVIQRNGAFSRALISPPEPPQTFSELEGFTQQSQERLELD